MKAEKKRGGTKAQIRAASTLTTLLNALFSLRKNLNRIPVNRFLKHPNPILTVTLNL
jgi:hypothetical protein